MGLHAEAYSPALSTQTHSHCVAMFNIPEKEEEEPSPRPPNSYTSTGSDQSERVISYTTARKDEVEDTSHHAGGSFIDIVNNPYTVTPFFQAQTPLLTIHYAPTSTHGTAPPKAIIPSLEGPPSSFPRISLTRPHSSRPPTPPPWPHPPRLPLPPRQTAALAHQAIYWPLQPAGGYVQCGYPGCGESVGLVSAKDVWAHLAGHLNGGKAYMCFWCVLDASFSPFVNEAEDG
ncbi:hypothetical protein M422DRAFT_263936 [Sphaerobolus stellatus SS14]|uniref:Uncharacterized protein n=1 Tax=Sphaerobolus stellatus (strain SS14) TaxID=990650 RepID=A0A0C9V9N1_SPHS4|nr:hypothetical protein M422DRAFT_263936 [Sphaerobolus stellatus SS14]